MEVVLRYLCADSCLHSINESLLGCVIEREPHLVARALVSVRSASDGMAAVGRPALLALEHPARPTCRRALLTTRSHELRVVVDQKCAVVQLVAFLGRNTPLLQRRARVTMLWTEQRHLVNIIREAWTRLMEVARSRIETSKARSVHGRRIV